MAYMTWQRRLCGFGVIVWTFWLVFSVRTYFREHSKFSIVMMALSAFNIMFDLAAFKNGWLMTDANKRQRSE